MGRTGRGGLLLILLAAVACGGDGGREESPPVESDAGAATEPGRYLGVLTLEGGAEVVLCDGTPLEVDGPALLEMTGLHADLTPGSEPMEGIFVDVLGEIREDARGPWLNALELRRAAREGWGCGRDEEALLVEASGTEPFWTLTVADTVATWRTPEGMQRFVHPGPLRMPRGGWEVVGRDAGGGAELRAEFYQEPCRNAMSGAWSHLTAEVVLQGRELRGCGFVGVAGEGAF